MCRRWLRGKIGAGAWEKRIREWEFRALIPRHFCNSRRKKGVFRGRHCTRFRERYCG